MLKISKFVFNPFSVNTYIVYSETKEALIIDPGMYDAVERKELTDFISENELRIIKIINTHCHLDHVFGLGFASNEFAVLPNYHIDEIPVVQDTPQSAAIFGLKMDKLPENKELIDENTVVQIGESVFKVISTPGHTLGHVCLYNAKEKILFTGDTLFDGSIGRTDLPGGNFESISRSIKTKLYILPDDTQVFPGHGNSTTIGKEKKHNPFIKL